MHKLPNAAHGRPLACAPGHCFGKAGKRMGESANARTLSPRSLLSAIRCPLGPDACPLAWRLARGQSSSFGHAGEDRPAAPTGRCAPSQRHASLPSETIGAHLARLAQRVALRARFTGLPPRERSAICTQREINTPLPSCLAIHADSPALDVPSCRAKDADKRKNSLLFVGETGAPWGRNPVQFGTPNHHSWKREHHQGMD